MTRCQAVERKCISIRCSVSSYRTTCSNRDRSKSPPISRLIRASKFLLNAAVTPVGIVIGSFQHRERLLQIGGEQKGIVLTKNCANFAEKLIARRTVEIPNRAAQKKNEQSFVIAPARGYFLQPVEIGAFESHQAHPIDLPQFLLTS